MAGFVSPVAPPAQSATDLATACVLCSHNCGLRVDVEGGRIAEVRPDPGSPITQGYACNKAFAIPHYVNHAQRVQEPLRRRPDGSFEPVSWDLAISEIGAALGRLRREHGANSIALVGVGGQGNHLDGPYAIALLMALGSPWWFNALAQEKTQHALVDDWMFGATPAAYLHPDLEHSRYLLVMGTNPLVSNRGHNPSELFKQVKADPGRTLVVVNPRRTQTTRGADEHVVVRPGMDTYFLAGLAAVIVREGLHDQRFLAAHARGLDAASAALRAVDPADMAARAGIPREQLERVARGFATTQSASIMIDLGVEQAPFSTLNSYLVRLCLALTGNLGNRGGNVFHGTFSPAAPRLDRKPFRAPVSGIEAIAMLAPLGMFSPNLLPEEISADRPDRIRAVICEGANPMIQAAGTGELEAAVAKLDLLVVIDPAMSETARRAHWVLPAPVGYEKWEYAGFPKAYPGILAQLRPPVVVGPAQALPEAEIFARLARAAGVIEPAPRGLRWLARRAGSPAGAAAFLAAVTAAALVKGRGTGGATARVALWTYEVLGPELPAPALSAMWLVSHLFALTRRADVLRSLPEARSLRMPGALGNFLFRKLLEHPEGVELAQLDPTRNLAAHVKHPGGRIQLAPPAMLSELGRALAAPAAPDADYPLILNGGQRTHWNANTIQRDPAWRKGKGPHCAVTLHPTDAEPLGIRDGALVEVATRHGSVRLPAVLDDGVRPGSLLIPNGFGLEYPDPATGQLRATGVAVNRLTSTQERDPFTGCPHHKYIRCRVRPVASAQASAG